MRELHTVYRLEDDKRMIKILQDASLDRGDSGLKIENNLLIGSKDWFAAISTGITERRSVFGTICKVYMSGHNDYPEFEIDSNGEKSRWTRDGNEELYRTNKQVELTYVIQKFKTPIDILGPTTKMVIEIKIEK